MVRGVLFRPSLNHNTHSCHLHNYHIYSLITTMRLEHRYVLDLEEEKNVEDGQDGVLRMLLESESEKV